MNVLPEDKFATAVAMFCGGKSIREVSRTCGCHRDTAHKVRSAVIEAYRQAGQPFYEITGGRPRNGGVARREIPSNTRVQVREYVAKRLGLDQPEEIP